MKTLFTVLFMILLLTCALKVPALPRPSPQNQKTSSTSSNKNSVNDEGEKKFRENCGRCHHPPESLSPREVKAVLQHMRVRAMLSAEDEQLILKYLAP